MPVDVGTDQIVSWTRGSDAAGQVVTLTVTDPNVATTTPAVTEGAGTGKYVATVPTTLVGRYVLAWAAPTEHFADVMNVWPADPRFLISLEQASKALRWRPADFDMHGEDLRLYVASATEIIEDLSGALLVRTVEQFEDGGVTGVLLFERPDEVLTVEVDGAAWVGYVVDKSAAIVYPSVNPNGRFPGGRQAVKVTYRVGMQVVSPSIQQAARELVAHMWQIGMQAPTPRPTPGQGQEMFKTPSGYLVPNRVAELCGSHHPMPGIA